MNLNTTANRTSIGTQNGNVVELPETLRIRAYQKSQGLEPCYLTDTRYTCEADCQWRSMCKKLVAAWLR